MSRRLPVVAVVGRPNVGKSTLFNRFVGHRLAIVDDRPGVTRDRHFARADWAGHDFFVVDTGGVIEGSDQPLDLKVKGQALAAVAEADVILFMVDAKDGVHPLDERIAELLRDAETPVLLVANKVDNLPHEMSHHDFWSLGMGEPIPVSAASGKGSGDLLDRVVERFPERKLQEPPPEEIRVAVVGKPNVGKSSLVNQLFGEERVVVSDEPGTTRDPVDTLIRYHGRPLVFVDTAGLRRQSRVKESVEYYSALRTARVVRESDVCLVLFDSLEGLVNQDVRIAQQAWNAGCSVALLANKWDLVEKDESTAGVYERLIHERAPFLRWIPVLFTSALTGQRTRKALELVLQLDQERNRRIDTSEVNEALREIVARQPPPHSRGRAVKLKYATQVSVAPPTFLLFSNLPREIPTHYIRYIENGFRDRWTFRGTPIRIRFKES